jgi:hypothetical protein
MTDGNPSYPSLPDQGKNLAKFAFDVIKTAFIEGHLFVSEEVQQKRLNVCKDCPWFDPEQTRCKHCGCFLESKVKFSLESCPLKKWEESDYDWMNGKYEDVLSDLENPPEQTCGDDHPPFPSHADPGDVFEWEGNRWKWSGIWWEPLPPDYQ